LRHLPHRLDMTEVIRQLIAEGWEVTADLRF
jgi:hypothetical protein